MSFASAPTLCAWSGRMTEIELLRSAVGTLNRMLGNARPQDIIVEALRSVPDGQLATVSSFGTESAVLLKFVADVDPAIPVLFLDTGWLFEETLDYRDTLARRLGLKDIRTLNPDAATLQNDDPDRKSTRLNSSHVKRSRMPSSA